MSCKCPSDSEVCLKKFNKPLNLFNLLSKTNLNHNTKFPEAQVEFYAKGDYGNVQGKFAALSEWGHSEEGYVWDVSLLMRTDIPN